MTASDRPSEPARNDRYPTDRDGTDDQTDETTTDSDDAEPHVLILEDDDALRRLLKYKFEASGYETTTISDGRECWAYLTTEPAPDLVILDVMVPGPNGFQLLERIRADERLADVPVVLLTARGREEDVLKGFELGADDYVTKPFSPSVLVARLGRFVS